MIPAEGNQANAAKIQTATVYINEAQDANKKRACKHAANNSSTSVSIFIAMFKLAAGGTSEWTVMNESY